LQSKGNYPYKTCQSITANNYITLKEAKCVIKLPGLKKYIKFVQCNVINLHAVIFDSVTAG